MWKTGTESLLHLAKDVRCDRDMNVLTDARFTSMDDDLALLIKLIPEDLSTPMRRHMATQITRILKGEN